MKPPKHRWKDGVEVKNKWETYNDGFDYFKSPSKEDLNEFLTAEGIYYSNV